MSSSQSPRTTTTSSPFLPWAWNSNYPAKPLRRIYLPLSKLESCNVCHKTSKETRLRWCQLCAEVVYCSTECQQQDWPEHKRRYCGKNKTDRVEIESYWPFLAILVSQFKEYTNFTSHPALKHSIINSPNPCNKFHPTLNPCGTVARDQHPSSSWNTDMDPTEDRLSGKYPICFPGGVYAKPIVLGEKLGRFNGKPETWWQTAISSSVREKLQRRIAMEGLLLPTNLCLCLALLSVMYTTTAIPDSEDEDETLQPTGRRRVRLTCSNSPVTDFGLAMGSVEVPENNRLAYIFTVDNPDVKAKKGDYRLGQNPDDHYRIYIQTLSGHEWYLDFGQYTLNACTLAQTQPYCAGNWGSFRRCDNYSVPGMFFGKEYEKVGGLDIFKLRRRFSILRNARAQDIVQWRNRDSDIFNITKLIKEIKDGEECTPWESWATVKFLPEAVELIHLNVVDREYLKFPKRPKLAMDTDPDEESEMKEGLEEKMKIFERTGKWPKKFKKGVDGLRKNI